MWELIMWMGLAFLVGYATAPKPDVLTEAEVQKIFNAGASEALKIVREEMENLKEEHENANHDQDT